MTRTIWGMFGKGRMPSTREQLQETATREGWSPVENSHQKVDIYRAEPYSVMVEFSRDGMVIAAQLFADAPETRQKLPPRQIKSVDKNVDNKRRRVSSWFYHYKQAS